MSFKEQGVLGSDLCFNSPECHGGQWIQEGKTTGATNEETGQAFDMKC